jgi:hypothetical protein
MAHLCRKGMGCGLRLHIVLHHPRVIEYVCNLPPRQVSRTIERLLLQALENDEVLAAKVAEEVVRRLEARGWPDGKREADGNQGDTDAATALGEQVPHNAVTAFLRTWGDDD